MDSNYIQIFNFLCDLITENFNFFRKIMELEEELKVVGNSLKSLEVSEEKVCGTCNPRSGSVVLVETLLTSPAIPLE